MSLVQIRLFGWPIWTAHEAFKRTSGAKALTIASLYGTAEAVPFVPNATRKLVVIQTAPLDKTN
jgi:hypothetical protein